MEKSAKKGIQFKGYNRSKLLLELIVVFLGVSSGFILNNWRTQQRDKELEVKYIAGFIQDMNDNIPEVESILESDSIWLERATPMLLAIRNKSLQKDSAEAAIAMIIGVQKLNLNTGTYRDITNSGNLNLIRDFVLKRQIIDYHLALEGATFLDNYFYTYFSDLVMPFIFSEYSVLTQEFKDLEIIRTIEFSNVFAGYFSLVQQRVAEYKTLLEESYGLKDMLTPLPGTEK